MFKIVCILLPYVELGYPRRGRISYIQISLESRYLDTVGNYRTSEGEVGNVDARV